ncbi:hypothetical protein [Carbonactinospora thermoautotrophica]|uniref:hypothetical protein n=1 Tax=Carbonactinospora thermoautotrophica TaxID=1469144 RepID=UPI00226F01C5|nr:hypothetical protein [Carbonactinospora thermoautotrophica]
MSVADLDEQQHRLVLTAHPLQRVGAYALAELTGAEEPEKVTPEGFRTAVEKMTADAVRAAKVRDTKAPDGFWLKVSLSFFPNSKMNHNAQLKKSDEELDAGIREWRTPPELASWPGVRCVLCGREAVGFYGKVDVPLAESHLYRNTTPRGHAGLALCWPCVCSFHALPYGCRLTGGPSIALHSWDERFLARVVSRQVERNHQHIVLGRAADKIPAREVVALHALRHYGERLTAGVELLVFSNNNKGQTLEIHSLEQPLAEWLRKTARRPELRQGFAALLRAHAGPKSPGVVGLARNAFHDPERIPAACARYLADRFDRSGLVPSDAADLAGLCSSFAIEVMWMKENDLAEIKATAHSVALLLNRETSAGKLREFHSTLKDPGRMQAWLRTRAVEWTLNPPEGADRPLLGSRAFQLLFDTGSDNRAWFHRQLLFVAVLEELHRLGWRPADGAAVAKEITEEDQPLGEDDTKYLQGEESL